MNHSLRQKDFLSYQRPDYIITNSIEVKNRIEKFYRRQANVIYPPINIFSGKRKEQSGKDESLITPRLSLNAKAYYLTGGRLARAKHTDLAILACKKLGIKLKVFGRGFADYEKELHGIADGNIEFVGEVTDSQLATLFTAAKGYIFPSEYEDFGIVAIEAAAYGCPVIGYKQGGIKESVVDGKTGILFDKLSVDGVVSGIRRLEKIKILPKDCHKHASKFTKTRFKREIKQFVEEKYQEFNKQ
jgi:glycosyltransferase involved in cell wall biosynthesis